MNPESAKSISLEAVTKRFGAVNAVNAVDLHVRPGEFLTLLGPSGCGKTTLLRMLAGLESVTAGRIFYGGDEITDLPPQRRDLAIMFQDYALFPHMSLRDNVAYGLKMAGQPLAQRSYEADRWLERFELSAMADRRPDALSGGQRQRVALARALITNPGVLLLDEPLSALDANLRVHLRAELRRIHQEEGRTFICVTHDQEEAMVLSDRIAVLRAGQLEQLGTPDALYDAPANAFVASFFGRCALWPARVTNGRAALEAGQSVAVAGHWPAGAKVQLVIRPEAIEIDAAGAFSAEVQDVQTRGAMADIALATGAYTCTAEVQRRGGDLPSTGTSVGFNIAGPVPAVPAA